MNFSDDEKKIIDDTILLFEKGYVLFSDEEDVLRYQNDNIIVEIWNDRYEDLPEVYIKFKKIDFKFRLEFFMSFLEGELNYPSSFDEILGRLDYFNKNHENFTDIKYCLNLKYQIEDEYIEKDPESEKYYNIDERIDLKKSSDEILESHGYINLFLKKYEDFNYFKKKFTESYPKDIRLLIYIIIVAAIIMFIMYHFGLNNGRLFSILMIPLSVSLKNSVVNSIHKKTVKRLALKMYHLYLKNKIVIQRKTIYCCSNYKVFLYIDSKKESINQDFQDYLEKSVKELIDSDQYFKNLLNEFCLTKYSDDLKSQKEQETHNSLIEYVSSSLNTLGCEMEFVRFGFGIDDEMFRVYIKTKDGYFIM